MEQILNQTGKIKLGDVLDAGHASLAEAIRTIHKKSLSPKTLESLCLDACVSNAKHMVYWHEKLNLPNSLKNKLLEFYPNCFSSRSIPLHSNWLASKRLICLLLNNETKDLDFSRWVSFSYWTEDFVSNIIELLQEVVTKAPNLEKLSVYCFNADEYEITAQVLDSIMLIKSLKQLEVRGLCWLRDEELLKIPLKLPKLVTLKVQLDYSITTDAFVNFPLLKDLQQFYFWMDDSYDPDDVDTQLNERIYSWCASKLPQLRLIGGTTEMNSGMNINLFQLTPHFSGTSNLEYLHTSHLLPSGDLPNLKYLFLRSPFFGSLEMVLSQLSQYEKLTHLTLDAPDLYPILRTIGKQLTDFYFGAGQGHTIDYFEILFLCPNLKKLFQCSGSPCILESPFQNRIKTPTALEDVFLQMFKKQSTKGLLRTIFQSPEIKNVYLRGFFFGLADILGRDELPRGLPSLESLVLVDLQLYDDCPMVMFAEMITLLIVLAPNLKNVTVRWTWDTNLLAEWNRQTEVNEYITIVNNKSPRTNFDADDDDEDEDEDDDDEDEDEDEDDDDEDEDEDEDDDDEDDDDDDECL